MPETGRGLNFAFGRGDDRSFFIRMRQDTANSADWTMLVPARQRRTMRWLVQGPQLAT